MALRVVMAYSLILAPGILNKIIAFTKPSQEKSSSGFTLLELMIVIVIVGIMFSFLVLSIRGSSPEEAINTEARRLNQLIGLALEEAILRGEEYAIVFKPNSYQFVRLSENGWQAIQGDRQLRTRELPEDITIELEIDNIELTLSRDQKTDETKLKPHVFLLSSGEITPEFTVNLVIFGIDTSYHIAGKMNGQLFLSNRGSDG